ncbi:MAG: acyltransferase family protein, partial [Flavobacteriaceae bacterium]
GLLDISTIDTQNIFYRFWLYCRGFTAPIFFTITGWIFTFLLLKEEKEGLNPRIKKGIKRGVELLIWGYLLRLNLPSLLWGSFNDSFTQPDVLHIIGLSIGFILLFYTGLRFLKNHLAWIFLTFGLILFLLEPAYSQLNLDSLPKFLAAYLIKGYGGVFYLLPWLGYVFIGSSLAFFFNSRYATYKTWILPSTLLGLLLIFASSMLLNSLGIVLNLSLFKQVAQNNFLFIRLGDFFLLLSFFMLFQSGFQNKLWRFLGTNTLVLYIVHYFILYGSITGWGLYKFFAHQLSLGETVLGLILFLAGCIGIVFVKDFKKLNP